MKIILGFICLLALSACNIQQVTDMLEETQKALQNPEKGTLALEKAVQEKTQKVLQNPEEEHKKLSELNTETFATEAYTQFGSKKDITIPTNCKDFLASFKSKNDDVYFSNKKVEQYNVSNLFALLKGLDICQHYDLDEKIAQEVVLEGVIKEYQNERNKNSWVIQLKKSIPNADDILVFASVIIPNYDTQRFGGSLSDLVYAFANTNNEMSSFDVNKKRLQINNINGTTTIYFAETVKNVWVIKSLEGPDGTRVSDASSLGLFLEPLIPSTAQLDFQRKMKKLENGKTVKENTSGGNKETTLVIAL